DPRDGGKTIIPDLAHSWQIAKDGKTYTFFLRQGVQFSDGAELTAEDIKATFDRIAKPSQGITIPRSILFKAVGEINARDKYTVEFTDGAVEGILLDLVDDGAAGLACGGPEGPWVPPAQTPR